MSALPPAVALWREDPASSATLAATRAYWHFDGTAYDTVSSPALETHKLADIGGGVFDFVLVSAIAPGTATMSVAFVGGSFMAY